MQKEGYDVVVVGAGSLWRLVKALEPFIQQVIHALVEAFEKDHQADLISQFGYPLPLEVALHLIGVPREDMAATKKLSDCTSMLVNSPLPEELQVAYARAFVQEQHFFLQLINERRKSPRQELISDLLDRLGRKQQPMPRRSRQQPGLDHDHR